MTFDSLSASPYLLVGTPHSNYTLYFLRKG